MRLSIDLQYDRTVGRQWRLIRSGLPGHTNKYEEGRMHYDISVVHSDPAEVPGEHDSGTNLLR